MIIIFVSHYCHYYYYCFHSTCLEYAYLNLGADAESKAARDRLEVVQKGGIFCRKAMLGMVSQELYLKLSDDQSAIEVRGIAITFISIKVY